MNTLTNDYLRSIADGKWCDSGKAHQEMAQRLLAAESTLDSAGYTYNGGQLWKPPVGPRPNFNLLDAKQARIDALEAQLAELRGQEPDLYLCPVTRSGEKLFSPCGRDYPRGRGYYTRPVPPAITDITAEHLRVIEMLLSVCQAAFYLADDTCEQEVDGEIAHVVPAESFMKLSAALDEIDNTLPNGYEDILNTLFEFAAIPRQALRKLFDGCPVPPAASQPVVWIVERFTSAGMLMWKQAFLDKQTPKATKEDNTSFYDVVTEIPASQPYTVPDEISVAEAIERSKKDPTCSPAIAYQHGWKDRSAAMLQSGGKS